jgi:8-oxo-dGTP diphosphatase
VRTAEVDCVGAVVHDDQRRLLLVLRGTEPAKGTWSIPGGRVEAGESDAEALAREVLEETGLEVLVDEHVGTVHRDAPGGGIFVIRDYRCRLRPGVDGADVRAGDDAADIGWFGAEELFGLPCAPGLLEALSGWGVLPA